MGLQIFSGVLKKRCILKNFGIEKFAEESNFRKISFCHDETNCGNYSICGKIINNPNWGLTNFDTFLYSFLQVKFLNNILIKSILYLKVFQSVTLEGWSSIMISLQKSFNFWIWIYFYIIIVIGSFFLVNITLAIIKFKFTQSEDFEKIKKIEKNEIISYPLRKFKILGIYKKKEKNYSNC